MVNDSRLFATAKNAGPPTAYAYAGVNTDRQSRFEARSARRWGDWGILEFPAPLLWLETEPGLCWDDECIVTPPLVVELWP